MNITGMINNRNVAHTRRALEELGATVTDVQQGTRHYQVFFTTAGGVAHWVNVAKHPVDPHKLRTFARQKYNAAAGHVEHVRQQMQNRR